MNRPNLLPKNGDAEALGASELRYRRLFESAKDGILILDAESGLVVDVNPFLIQLLGYSREEFLGKEIWELGFFRDVVASKENFVELQQQKYIRYEDKPLETSTGSRVDVEVVSNVYLVEGKQVIQCNIRDITERKRMEKLLRNNEQALRSLTESMPQIVWIAEPDGANIYFNHQWVEYTGLTLEESRGDGWTTPLHPDDKQQVRDAWQHSVAHNELYSVECRLRRLDGVYRWWLIRGVSVVDANGRILNWFGTCTDMEKIKRFQEKLNEAKVNAEAANQAKSDFLASMSHELRTPLNAIIGFSEMLADETFGKLNKKQGKYVDNVLEAGRHLLSLINDILDLAKVESGKMQVVHSTFPLATTLKQSLILVKEKCLQHKIELVLDLHETVADLQVSADERKLKQIMYNLLSNAVKFTAEGGIITVKAGLGGPLNTECDPTSFPPAQTDADHSTFLITVSDTGIGIEPSNQERIFREFEQVDSKDTPKLKGTGLGLKLVKQFVELQGGRVGVESEFGKGSRFWFTIPIGTK